MSEDIVAGFDANDLTVSMTFKDSAKKTMLKITAAVTREDHDKMKEDDTGALLAQYVVGHVAHHLKNLKNKLD